MSYLMHPSFKLSLLSLAILVCQQGFAEDTQQLATITMTAEPAKADQSSEHTQRYIIQNSATASKLDIPLKETPQTVNVVTRQQLEHALWGDDPPDGDMLRSHIYELRRSVDGNQPVKLIHTLPRIGYRVAVVDDAYAS